MVALLEMISKTKGRPKNAVVSEFKTNGLASFILGGEKRTDRTVVNKAYRQRGYAFLLDAGLMIEIMGIDPDIESERDKGFPKGWETFMTEVGRWAERFNNTAERVQQVAALPGSLTYKAGLLKKVRVGEKGISTEALKKRVDVFADDILRRFPKCDLFELAAAFRSAADVVSLLAENQSADEIES
jgi:hypothetical protein